MKFISLFSGIGGFDLAFQRAGMESVAVCEIDKAAQGVLRRHFQNVPIFDDVKEIGVNTHGRGTVDLICGGFPCQDVSIAGKRKGLAGERSGLWFEFERIIGELEPAWVVIENVPGLLSSNAGEDFAAILHGLSEWGYGICWRVFDAEYFGLGQRRRRVFIVANIGTGSAAKVLFESDGSGGDNAPVGEGGEGITKGITDGTGSAGGKQGILGFARQRSDEYIESDIVSTIAQRDYKSASDLILSPAGVRRLTPMECERLQGFPDGWTDGQSDTQRYKQLGNAVAVPVVEWIGRRIKECYDLV